MEGVETNVTKNPHYNKGAVLTYSYFFPVQWPPDEGNRFMLALPVISSLYWGNLSCSPHSGWWDTVPVGDATALATVMGFGFQHQAPAASLHLQFPGNMLLVDSFLMFFSRSFGTNQFTTMSHFITLTCAMFFNVC